MAGVNPRRADKKSNSKLKKLMPNAEESFAIFAKVYQLKKTVIATIAIIRNMHSSAETTKWSNERTN